jgi:Aldo/keto reductase family
MSAGAPVELDELSAVGFGCYRVDPRVRLHREALREALVAGCTLIDTASNYADGRSEELIGGVLAETSRPAFVITKVGYVSPSAARELDRAGVGSAGLARLSGTTRFSLEPAVLRVLLALSRLRLRRPTLDAVLLHNPERLLQAGVPADDVCDAVKDAFVFLAGEVDAGRLRYFGVSSNTLPAAGPDDTLNFEAIAELSAGSGNPEAFRFAQFPFNLLERRAAIDGARPALLSRVPPAIHTLANRPLNALDGGHLVRLAETGIEDSLDDPWQQCVDVVARRLRELDEDTPWTSFRPMQFLRASRNDIPDPSLVNDIWKHQVEPFLSALFEGSPPHASEDPFEQLRAHACQCAARRLAESTQAATANLMGQGMLDRLPGESLATAAIRFCIDAGVDHVLVGMRQPTYVAELSPLFQRATKSRP